MTQFTYECDELHIDIHPDNILIQPICDHTEAVADFLGKRGNEVNDVGPVPFPVPPVDDLYVTLGDLESCTYPFPSGSVLLCSDTVKHTWCPITR